MMARPSIIPTRQTMQRQAGVWWRQYSRQVAGEFGKHPGVAVAFVLLLLYVYPAAIFRLLFAVGLVLALIKTLDFEIWARQRRQALRAVGHEIPPRKELKVAYREEQDRKRLLTRPSGKDDRKGGPTWHELCQAHGLTSANKQTPPLAALKPTLENDWSAVVPRGLFDPDDIKAKAPKIGKGLGCQIVVREPVTGVAELKFNWTNPLKRTLELKDLPMPRFGGIPIGITEAGDPAELRMDASKIFAGVQGSGKSNAAEAALGHLVGRGIPTRLYVSNPKQNEMRAFNQFVAQSMGTLEVRAYAESQAENLELISEFKASMMDRNQTMRGRKLKEPSVENPLCVLWLDEMMMLPKTVYKDGPYSDLGQICLAGRASLHIPWGCTQMFYASDFGTMRGIFDERVGFRVKTPEAADAIIDKATSRGALMHRLHPMKDRGVGWVEDEHGELTKFRAAKVEDHELENLIRCVAPKGMTTEPPPVEAAKPDQRVYFIEAGGTDLVKIGIAAAPKDRLRELQTASPHRLAMLATMPGGKPEESRLHRQFAASRATGEWFHRTPELDALIADVIAGAYEDGGPDGGGTRELVRKAQTVTREWIVRHANTPKSEPKPEPAPVLREVAFSE
jgi:Meiotically up-regulated gene 113